MHEILQKLATALKAEPDIAFAYLFGSVAKDGSGPPSDVEVAVYFYPAGDSHSRFKRRLELVSILGRMLRRDDVEVVPLQDAPVDLTFEILAHGKLVFSKADAQKAEFIFETLRRHHDDAQPHKFASEVIRNEVKREVYGRLPESYSRATQKLREMIARLERIRARGEAAYNHDDLLQSAAERALQIAAQCVLDIGNHLIADMSLPLPTDHDEIIDTLCKAGVISRELAASLADLGGVRNMLVHDYLTLDQGRLFHEHLEHLDDLRNFAAAIIKFFDEIDKQPQ